MVVLSEDSGIDLSAREGGAGGVSCECSSTCRWKKLSASCFLSSSLIVVDNCSSITDAHRHAHVRADAHRHAQLGSEAC